MAAYDSLDSAAYYEETAPALQSKVDTALEDLATALDAAEPRRLLDIGCGEGHFLEAVREAHPSIATVGHELPGQAAQACQAKGLDVRTNDLEQIQERFGIVAMLDVAEHLSDPTAVFSTAAALLAESGKFYLHTPRRMVWDSLALTALRFHIARSLAKKWLRTRVSIFHLQLWTERALIHSLSAAGLTVSYLRRETELSWPLETYGRVYLIKQFKFSDRFAQAILRLTGVVIRLGSFKNKAVCLAERGP